MRYLREAKAELEAARKVPFMAPSLVLEAIRKARNAIYYSLGEPAFIEIVIRETAEKMQGQPATDPILKFLVDIESMVQQLGQIEEMDGEQAMKRADGLVSIAQEIVEALTEEKVEN